MDAALWIVQGLLALVFVGAGGVKLVVPKDRLLRPMPWTSAWSQRAVWTIGALDVLGGIGVIAPAATGIVPTLTVAAAAGLALTLVGASIIHQRHREYARVATVMLLFTLAVFVVVGRLVLAPI
jgi:uncharacterized membrane protein